MFLRRSINIRLWLTAGLAVLLLILSGCATKWPAFRHGVARSANQQHSSALSSPARVPTLHVHAGWPFQPPGAQAFKASPIVYEGRVFIGNGNGRFYALNATTGALLWQYPAAVSPPLVSQFVCNPSSEGIASAAAIAEIGGKDAVIFAAPDQSIGAHLGSGRLFALETKTGAEIWKSDEIARITGTTSGSTTELHEQIGYSSPLVFNHHVYVAIADHCDNPIQNGRVVSVFLANGHIDPMFNFSATSTRGGGIWNSVAAWNGALYVTTGNSRCWNGGCQSEPGTNNALSLLRLDPNTGAIIWKHQPVPFSMDDDPDWTGGATVILSSCGVLVAGVQKDGWSYAVNAVSPGPPPAASVRWMFPPTSATFHFTPGDGTVHGDTRYLRPGAAWNDVYIVTTGGLNVTTNVNGGFRRLHALNACAPEADRVRWIIDVPNTSGFEYSLGPPTVTRGMVYVGTDQGHLVVIADPSIAPAVGLRCSNPDVPAVNCVASGFKLVPDPAVLANVALDGSVQTEPALAKSRVYVATDAGKLYMLEP